MFAKGFDYDQIAPVIAVAERDMENKKASYAGKLKDIQGRIEHKPSEGDADMQAAPQAKGGWPLPDGPAKAAYVQDAEGARAAVRAGKYTKEQAKAALLQEYPMAPPEAIDGLLKGL